MSCIAFRKSAVDLVDLVGFFDAVPQIVHTFEEAKAVRNFPCQTLKISKVWGHNDTPCRRPAPRGVIGAVLVTHLNQMPYERPTFDC
jgi:hypothetical protein